MANQLRFPAAVIQAMMDVLGALPDGSGFLRFYDGTQPAVGGGAITGQVLLAECALAADAFGACNSSGVITAGAIAADASINASGTATWFRIWKSDGTTPVVDGSVGTSGCDINLANNVLVLGGTLTITSFTLTHPLL